MKRKAWGGKRKGAGAKPIGDVPCTATLAVRVPADVLTKAVARAIFLLLTRLIAEYSTTGIASPT